MTRPLILLDVDGVLNALHQDTSVLEWKFLPTFKVGPFDMNLSQEMADALMSLDADIEWLTTWCMRDDEVNPNIGRALGWPKLPCHPDPGTGLRKMSFRSWWKQHAVDKIRAEQPDRPIIWIDDDLGGKIAENGGEQFDVKNNIFMVAPDTLMGLTPGDIERIKWFIARLK